MVAPNITASVQPRIITSLMKWSFIEKLNDIIKSKELQALKKVEKKGRFKKIEGLDPANNAGSKDSRDCTLILCEGLSAKTYAVTGIGVGIGGKQGRDWYGVYPLRGKLLNVRNASPTVISKNKEITDMIQALNVKHEIDYENNENFKTLNYGKIMILCDADLDGFHISGLILNFFHTLFPTLIKRDPSFIISMQTPIVRIFFQSRSISFYSEYDFEKYMEDHTNRRGRVKHYKGLGTSSDEEVRESFGKRVIEYKNDDTLTDNMNKVFHTKHSDDRKKWLQGFNPDNIYHFPDDTNIPMSVSDFMNYEMIKYSIDDCGRSIPSAIDGLKESQRKILYACFLRKLNSNGKSVKLAQLAGYIAEKTNYHHGEQCLHDTITKMAQAFPGSNNVPLLFRDGQFGSRSHGGKDAANARYIFTKLEPITRLIFRPEDDVLLDYIIDDGDKVEPRFYIPILPMIILNGCIVGIGTGWSCSIPCYNPLDIVDAVKTWINNDDKITNIMPWYRGFKGRIEKESENKYITYGNYHKDKNQVIVDELPIGYWTDKFKNFLDDQLENKGIKTVKNYSTPHEVKFVITESKNGIVCNIVTLGLSKSLHTSNMVLFTETGHLKKFDNIDQIIDEFCKVRYKYYKIRKDHIIKESKTSLKYLKNKHRFLQEVNSHDPDIHIDIRQDEVWVNKVLLERGYDKYIENDNPSYDYLLRLPIRSLTLNKINEVAKEIDNLTRSIQKIENTTEKEMWLKELSEFVVGYKKWLAEMDKQKIKKK